MDNNWTLWASSKQQHLSAMLLLGLQYTHNKTHWQKQKTRIYVIATSPFCKFITYSIYDVHLSKSFCQTARKNHKTLQWKKKGTLLATRMCFSTTKLNAKLINNNSYLQFQTRTEWTNANCINVNSWSIGGPAAATALSPQIGHVNIHSQNDNHVETKTQTWKHKQIPNHSKPLSPRRSYRRDAAVSMDESKDNCKTNKVH